MLSMASARNGMPFRTGMRTSIVATTTSQNYGLYRFSGNRHRVEGGSCHNARRLPHRGRSWRYVGQNECHGADLAIIADADVAQNLRVGAQFHIVAKDWRTAAFLPVSDGHAMPQCAVLAQHSFTVDEHTAEMPNAQALSDNAGFRQADSRHGLDEPKQQPVEPQTN